MIQMALEREHSFSDSACGSGGSAYRVRVGELFRELSDPGLALKNRLRIREADGSGVLSLPTSTSVPTFSLTGKQPRGSLAPFQPTKDGLAYVYYTRLWT